ncbi:hypothetical protein M422DRAFT_262034 [Sphaerobolus stellatus SS14]|uniref:Uncharacterized protein n=1 Tax=Sphaerobolus stellatus (strain SS14) TaxID=990650 RepID=A0A0C9V1S0_SPHS4|nr:hypothetical protein M422DRAFT_262034 [Sphaerobolus stellatus SS14]
MRAVRSQNNCREEDSELGQLVLPKDQCEGTATRSILARLVVGGLDDAAVQQILELLSGEECFEETDVLGLEFIHCLCATRRPATGDRSSGNLKTPCDLQIKTNNPVCLKPEANQMSHDIQ